MSLTFQEIIHNLNAYWSQNGCTILQAYDLEKGASTMSPGTFLRVLGPEPWQMACTDPCRRPTDGRYGDNPNRLQHYFQYQVILKPSPTNVQDLYLKSLTCLGIDLSCHDIRFVEDNWESPTLGAWGVGWEVWLDGLEVTQFTYFQQAGGQEVRPVAAEITYGLERLAMYLQNVDSIFDLKWSNHITYGELYHLNEYEQSLYNFEKSNPACLNTTFDLYQNECLELITEDLIYPAYEKLLKCSHIFNLQDARGILGRDERMKTILKIRQLSEKIAKSYIIKRLKLGFPLLQTTEREQIMIAYQQKFAELV